MKEYLRLLQKEFKGFPPDQQAALIEEVRSHIENGESDPAMGSDEDHRRDRLMKELGTPQDMGKRFRDIYRPNRFLEYLLVAIPYILSLFFTAYYMTLRPQYPWADIRLNVLFDLVVIAIAVWRRSVLVTLFWINFAIMQLLYIVLQGVWQPYWYFGTQTILWAVLLVGSILFLAQIAWKNRGDALIVVYAILPLCMELLATAVWSVQPISYTYGPLDRSLLVIFLKMQGGNAQLYGTLATMALFFLATNRNLRWMGLVLSALLIGLGRQYLFDYRTGSVAMAAQWIYYVYILVPLVLVCIAWQLERSRAEQAWQAA